LAVTINYVQYQDELAKIIATDVGDPNFSAIVPGTIDYAEQRIYRDLNLVATRVADTSKSTTPNQREFDLPAAHGTFITVTGVNVITPAGTDITNTTPSSVTPTRTALASATRNLVDYIAPSEIAASSDQTPSMYYMRDQDTIVLGPSPGGAFQVEVVGTIRPTPLSASNPTTFLCTYLPDLFIAASMVFLSGWMRNFGSQADDPKMAMSWEATYQQLLQSAQAEEARRRWNSELTPGMQPTRT
jgi:hypothetical protein